MRPDQVEIVNSAIRSAQKQIDELRSNLEAKKIDELRGLRTPPKSDRMVCLGGTTYVDPDEVAAFYCDDHEPSESSLLALRSGKTLWVKEPVEDVARKLGAIQ